MVSVGIDPRLRPASILLVEDHATVARLVARKLTELWEGGVITAAGVAEALERLTRRPGRPRLAGVVLDWHLGDNTAADVMEWLDLAYPRAPIVLYTGGLDPESAERFCATRDVRFIEKPTPPEELEPFVRDLFAPWDAQTRRARALLLVWAGAGERYLTEHLLRIMNAYLESVPEDQLGPARGIADESARKYISQIEEIFGCPIDHVRARWMRALLGRASHPPIPPPPREGRLSSS